MSSHSYCALLAVPRVIVTRTLNLNLCNCAYFQRVFDCIFSCATWHISVHFNWISVCYLAAAFQKCSWTLVLSVFVIFTQCSFIEFKYHIHLNSMLPMCCMTCNHTTSCMYFDPKQYVLYVFSWVSQPEWIKSYMPLLFILTFRNSLHNVGIIQEFLCCSLCKLLMVQPSRISLM